MVLCTCVGGGTIKVICSIKDAVRNFLWSGTAHRSRTKVAWTDCCLDRAHGGLGLINPEVAHKAMAVKWIITAMTPDDSILKTLLRHRILKICPKLKGSWPVDATWTLTSQFRGHRGSRAWDRILQACWRKLVKKLQPIAPRNRDEVLIH
jgi:hypothetical protein